MPPGRGFPSPPGVEGARPHPRVKPRAFARKMLQQARMASFFPAQPSLRLRLSQRDLFLNSFIVPAACESARHPLISLGRFWPPLQHPNKLMPPGCYFPSPPGAEGAQPHPRVKPRAVTRQKRQRAGLPSFSRHNHPLACGYLRALSLAPSPARLRICSPPSHLARAILAPSPASLQAHATRRPFSKPARR